LPRAPRGFNLFTLPFIGMRLADHHFTCEAGRIVLLLLMQALSSMAAFWAKHNPAL
jgi:hypothetical protein